MTNDELEQIMNFIIERHERLGERLDQIAAETTRQMELMSQQQELMSQQQELTTILLDAQVALTESVEKLTRKDAEHEERIARFERSYVAIAGLLQKHDERIAAHETQSMEHDEILAAHDTQNIKHDENIAALTDRLDRLAQTVERYIAARGTNGDTGNMPS